MPRRDDIKRVDLLLPEKVWKASRALARDRRISAEFRLELNALLGKSRTNWAALSESGKRPRGAVVRRHTVEIETQPLEMLDQAVAATCAKGATACRQWVLLAVFAGMVQRCGKEK